VCETAPSAEMVIVALRSLAVEFFVAVKVTVPLPEPETGVTLSQL